MKRKYFFFDIDGTLTDNTTRCVVPSALKALRKLEEAGHFVAIATGRAHYKARDFMEEIGLHNMVCGGGASLVINDQLCYHNPLDLEKAKDIIKEVDALGYGILLMLDDSIDVYMKNDRFREQVGERKEPTKYILDPTLDFDKLQEVYKIYVSISQAEEYRLTKKDTLGNLRFVKDYLMFQYDEKKQGILDMMKEIQGDIADVIVFGDDKNDLVMFDQCWTSVAMGNACEELKEKADYIAKANVEDGIYHMCEQQGWFAPVEN